MPREHGGHNHLHLKFSENQFITKQAPTTSHSVCVSVCVCVCVKTENTGYFIMSSVITNIYNKKIKGPTLMELFTATGKLKKFFFFFTTRDVR